MRYLWKIPAVLLVPLCLFVTACDSAEEDPLPLPEPRVVAEADYTVTDSGLKYYDFTVGEGEMPADSQVVELHYQLWLENGRLIDSTVLRGNPIIFPLDEDDLIPGFYEGLIGMQEGGDRQMVLPAALAYGEQGNGSIPPNATLIFEVELINVTEAEME